MGTQRVQMKGSFLGWFIGKKTLVVFLASRPVFRIRIHRIHMFLGLPDPDPFVRGMDPDPSVIMQK
jgi:hypothetical protein